MHHPYHKVGLALGLAPGLVLSGGVLAPSRWAHHGPHIATWCRDANLVGNKYMLATPLGANRTAAGAKAARCSGWAVEIKLESTIPG